MSSLIRRLLFSAKKQELEALAQLHQLADFVTLTGSFIHQLQRVRGLSNRVLYTPDAQCIALLEQQYSKIAEGADELSRATAQLLQSEHLLPARLQHALAQALQASELVAGLRQQVSELFSIQQYDTQPCEGYSQLIRCWLDVVVEVASISGVPQISETLLCLIYLLQAKEFAGQERAYGVVALSGKSAGALLSEQLKVLQCAEQDNLQALWRILTSAPYLLAQQQLAAMAQFYQLRHLINGLCENRQASPDLAVLWFELASARIDLMHLTMSDLMNDLSDQVKQSRAYIDQQEQLLAIQGSAAVTATDKLNNGNTWALALHSSGPQQSLFALLRKQSQYIAEIEMELGSSKVAVQELKMIQRAKLLLIERYHFGEQQAHHKLQKIAMDQQLSLAVVAENLVAQLTRPKHQA